MKTMKTLGYADLDRAKARLLKLSASSRVDVADKDYILEHIQAAQARIVEMTELDETGEEVSW